MCKLFRRFKKELSNGLEDLESKIRYAGCFKCPKQEKKL